MEKCITVQGQWKVRGIAPNSHSAAGVSLYGPHQQNLCFYFPEDLATMVELIPPKITSCISNDVIGLQPMLKTLFKWPFNLTFHSRNLIFKRFPSFQPYPLTFFTSSAASSLSRQLVWCKVVRLSAEIQLDQVLTGCSNDFSAEERVKPHTHTHTRTNTQNKVFLSVWD